MGNTCIPVADSFLYMAKPIQYYKVKKKTCKKNKKINGLVILIIGIPWWFNGFPRGSAVKNLSAMQDIMVRSLGQEDLLKKGIVTHSSILAWRIPGTEKPSGL